MKYFLFLLSLILFVISSFDGINENYPAAIWEICLSAYCLSLGGFIKYL